MFLDKERLDRSSVPTIIEFLLYGDPVYFRTYKNFLGRYADPLSSWAKEDSHRRALDRAFHKGGMDGFLDYLSEHAPKPVEPVELTDANASVSWNEFIREAAEYRIDCPKSDLNTFNEFILSKAGAEQNDIETVLWCFIAFTEGPLTMEGVPPLRLKDGFVGMFVPLECWIPEATDDGLRLSTTRYRVFNHILQNYITDKSDRNMQHLRGGPQWRGSNDAKRPRPLNRSKARIALEGGCPKDSMGLFLDIQFHFTVVFEWYQLALFRNGFSADEVVKEFSKFPLIRETFYHELRYFYKRKISRRLYNHHV